MCTLAANTIVGFMCIATVQAHIPSERQDQLLNVAQTNDVIARLIGVERTLDSFVLWECKPHQAHGRHLATHYPDLGLDEVRLCS